MNHQELADIIREEHQRSRVSIKKVHEGTGVSRSYLYCFFRDKQPVCFDILNRLANFYKLEYQITNENVVTKPDVYINDILDLIRYLREQLWIVDSIMKVSEKTGLKKSRLYDFRKGEAICLTKMDVLCSYYLVMYKIKNHSEVLTHDLQWVA